MAEERVKVSGGTVDLVQLSVRLGENDRICSRPPTAEELEDLDPKELHRLLQLCDLK